MTTRAKLVLENADDSFEVRRFEIRESISSPFEVDLVVRTTNEDVHFDSIVGHAASLRFDAWAPPSPGSSEGVEAGPSVQAWTGICASAAQLESEVTGVSTYRLRIVPSLWLLSQRINSRVFQNLTALEIALALLPEGVLTTAQVDEVAYPKLEMRVQYGETDLAFFDRILEEAGIAYAFEHVTPIDETDLRRSRLRFFDSRGKVEGDPTPLAFVDHPSPELEGTRWATGVTLEQQLRNDKLVLRGHDFRRSPAFELVGGAREAAPSGAEVESAKGSFVYAPGAFIVAGAAPDAALLDESRHDGKAAQAQAERALRAARGDRRVVSLRTNREDVTPGRTFAVTGHPRHDLTPSDELLCTSFRATGEFGSEMKFSLTGVYVAEGFRPARKTPKPKIVGVQSAIVVGPDGDEIHVDAYGRVRVRFHWDHEPRPAGESSCWVRVSQGWAGAGFGQITLPRIGHEVLVGFIDGDPDQPVVEGSVFSGTTRVPYDLPANATVSTWKSASVPATGGFNEIKFEDRAGAEQVYVQAERDLVKLVKQSETETTGTTRTQLIGVDRRIAVGGLDSTLVGVHHVVAMKPPGKHGHRHRGRDGRPIKYTKAKPTKIDMVNDRIVLKTSGGASITLEHDTIRLDAPGGIFLKALESIDVRVQDGDVVIQGGPMVHINPTKPKKSDDDDQSLVDEDEDENEVGVAADDDGGEDLDDDFDDEGEDLDDDDLDDDDDDDDGDDAARP